jgi:hypothetical protein
LGCAPDEEDSAYPSCPNSKCPPANNTVSIIVTPPEDSPYVVQQHTGIDLTKGNLSIQLDGTAVLRGKVQTATNSTQMEGRVQTKVEATIIAQALGDIPGENYRFKTSSELSPGEDNNFELRVLRGKTYEFSVTIEEAASMPTWSFKDTIYDSNDSYDINIEGEGDLWQIKGRIVLDKAGQQPAIGVKVVAETVATKGIIQESTTAITDDNGQFTLYTYPIQGIYSFKVASGSSSTTLIPTVKFEGIELDGNAELPEDLVIGEVGSALYVTLKFRGQLGNETKPLANAQITCSTSQARGNFVAYGTTDKQGQLTLNLLEGEYTITIVPDIEDHFAMHRENVVIDQTHAASLTPIFVPLKIDIVGQIKVPGNSGPAREAEVTATLIQTSDPALQFMTPRPYQTVTDEQGNYQLKVDTGLYRLLIIPAETSGLPWTATSPLIVQSALELDTITLNKPGIIHGLVIGAIENRGIAGAKIEIFEHTTYQPADDPANPPYVAALGATETNENGEFELVLPLVTEENVP